MALTATSVVQAQADWADPIDSVEYPNLDIGHYPVHEGKGNCHRCVSLTRKTMYAFKNPDCRVIPFPDSPLGAKNMVEMAQAGNCYEDNPADYVTHLGIFKMVCKGFN